MATAATTIQAPETQHVSPQAEEVIERLMNILCCRNDYCRQCFDSITGNNKEKKLTKEDIQHPVLTHQPVTKLDSSASSKTSSRSRMGSSGYYSSPFSPQNSPVFAFAPREHKDSESSFSAMSRKDSSSSSVPDSPASFGKKCATPVIDMKPIEFWTANRETVQPRPQKRRLPSESEISIDDFNPDIYDEAGHSDDCLTDEQKLNIYKLGQLHFSVHYEINNKVLVVKIIEARDLPLPYNQDRQDMARSNPYVKACLLPYHKDSRQTTVQRKTQSPLWNESLRFEVGFKDVQNRALELTVKDFDKYSRHCVIGSIKVDLTGVQLVKGTHMWKPLQPTGLEQEDLGELLLSLNYLPSAGRLNCDVIKAKNLLQTDFEGGADPYVKVSLCFGDKTIKTKKSSVKRNTLEPIFNETLSFNVGADVMEDCSLLVTVWDYNSKSRDDMMGRVVLGRQATGSQEKNHWVSMLSSHRSPVAQWHCLKPRDKCDKRPLSSTSS